MNIKQKHNFGWFEKWLRIVSKIVLFFYCVSIFPLTIPIKSLASENIPSEFPGGNFQYQNLDLIIAAPGFPLSVIRTYNSKSAFRGLFGHGWHFAFDQSLLLRSDKNQIYLIEGDGSIIAFKHDSQRAIFISKQAGYQTIEQHSNGSYLRVIPKGLKFYYGPTGRLLKMTDLNRNEINLKYSQDGHLEQIVSSNGKTLTFSYDADGNVRSIVDPIGRRYLYQINKNGDLVNYTDSMGRSTLYHYDTYHNLVKIRYPDGAIRKLSYDTEKDVLLSDIGPGSAKAVYKYNFASREIEVTDGNGNTAKVTFNENFRKKTITDSLGAQSILQYQEDGLLVLHRDALGNETTYEYDDRGNLTGSTNALGFEAHVEYHPTLNLPTIITDTMGGQYELEYDKRGNPIGMANPDGVKDRLVYNRMGQVTRYIRPNGNTIFYEYDEQGNPIRIKDTIGNVAEIEYNAVGQPVKRVHPDGSWFSFRYSPSGMITVLTDSNHRVTRFVYDERDRVVSVINPEGNQDSSTYDKRGLLSSFQNALNYKTSFSYDAAGKLVKLIDANRNETSYRYDAMNRLVEKIDAEGNTFRYEYDLLGRVIAATDALEQTIRYSYNEVGKLVRKSYPDGRNVRFTYNPAGIVTSVMGKDTALYFSYDNTNRIISKKDDIAGLGIRYSYDKIGRIAKIELSTGEKIKYTYDGRGRLKAILGPLEGTTEYSFDVMDRPILIRRANNTASYFKYDSLGRLFDIRHTTVNDNYINSSSYDFDQLDNRISVKIDDTSLTTYDYDKLSQLIKEKSDSGYAEAFRYDAVGNRIESSGKIKEIFKYDRLNRLISKGNNQYDFDVNGNLIEKRTDHGVTRYGYDPDGNLIAVELPDGKKYDYTYNAFGNRVTCSGPEGKIIYFYDKEDVLAEVSDKPRPKRIYIHGPGVDDHLSFVENEKRYDVHTDGLGSVTVITDSGGRVLSRYSYAAFGQVQKIKEKISTPFLFTGARYDAESNFYYLRSRAYDPTTGRFISPDVIGIAGGINLYRYVYNNPVNFVDPSGKTFGLATLAGTVIGGIVGAAGAAIRGGDIKAGMLGGAASGAAAGLIIDLAPVALAALGVGTVLSATGVVTLTASSAVAVGAVAGSVGSATGSYVEQGSANYLKGQDWHKDMNYTKIKASAATGLALGAVSGGIGHKIASAWGPSVKATQQSISTFRGGMAQASAGRTMQLSDGVRDLGRLLGDINQVLNIENVITIGQFEVIDEVITPSTADLTDKKVKDYQSLDNKIGILKAKLADLNAAKSKLGKLIAQREGIEHQANSKKNEIVSANTKAGEIESNVYSIKAELNKELIELTSSAQSEILAVNATTVNAIADFACDMAKNKDTFESAKGFAEKTEAEAKKALANIPEGTQITTKISKLDALITKTSNYESQLNAIINDQKGAVQQLKLLVGSVKPIYEDFVKVEKEATTKKEALQASINSISSVTGQSFNIDLKLYRVAANSPLPSMLHFNDANKHFEGTDLSINGIKAKAQSLKTEAVSFKAKIVNEQQSLKTLRNKIEAAVSRAKKCAKDQSESDEDQDSDDRDSPTDEDCRKLGYILNPDTRKCVPPFDENSTSRNQLMEGNEQDRQRETAEQNIADANLDPNEGKYTSDISDEEIKRMQEAVGAECGPRKQCSDPDKYNCVEGKCVKKQDDEKDDDKSDPKPPPEKSICNPPCSNGFKCVDGECKEKEKKFDCRKDGCKDKKERCDLKTGKCVKKGCKKDRDCKKGYRCKKGKCVKMECTKDSHCKSGYRCKKGKCVKKKPKPPVGYCPIGPDRNGDGLCDGCRKPYRPN